MADNPLEQNLSAAFPAQQADVGVVNPNFDPNNTALFNANTALLAAMQNYNALNAAVNQMIGIDSVWFRAIPQQRSKDVIFQEYTLSCVSDTPICPKVMVNSGNWPDSKYNYDLMGLEYEMPTEIQIDKNYWESIAGFGTAPQKKDIVYLPMPNKLYQVESCYLKRGFMEQETTWVCNLRKYQQEASRKEGPKLTETIDKYTVGEEKIFGKAIEGNIEKLIDDKQTSPFNSTSRDFYKEIDTDLNILSYNLDIQGVIAAQSFYDMSSSGTFDAVIYKNSADNITKINDRSILAWIMPRTVDQKIYGVSSIDLSTYLTANYAITVSGLKNIKKDDVFVIDRGGALNFYATVIDSSHGNTYYCKIDSDVETYLTSINPGWKGMRNYKMKVQNSINMINGINDSSINNFLVGVYANQYIKVIYGSQEKVFTMDSKILDNNWYAVVVNIGNTWGQLNAHVWKPAVSSIGDKLVSVFSKTLPLTPEETTITRYSLNKSDAFITNIRLFKTTIEDEKQTLELLSYLSKDADQALILDNADLKFMSPYVSRQR